MDESKQQQGALSGGGRPLAGKTVVVTRPKERAGTLSARLRSLGAEVLECPCIESVLQQDLSGLQAALGCSYDWAVFTSPTGVHMAVRALWKLGRDLRALYGMKLAAVGAGTAAVLREYGLTADLIPEIYDGAHLAEALLGELPEDGAVLILRGEGGGRDLPERLLEAGRIVADIPIYKTICRAEDAALLRERLNAGSVDAAAFTSASAVRGFAQSVEGCDLTGFAAICIGKQTAEAAEKYGMRIRIAAQATIDALIDCTVSALYSEGDGAARQTAASEPQSGALPALAASEPQGGVSPAETGLIHLYCGSGKGKTTAAMGLALRAAGRSLPVVIAQFLKDGTSGECRILQRLPQVTLLAANPCGKFSFQLNEDERAETKNRLAELFREAVEKAQSPGVLVLDEVCGALTNGFLELDEVLRFLKTKPEALEVVLTGRSPCEALCEAVDYQSEIRKCRHPYDRGVPARTGIEK